MTIEGIENELIEDFALFETWDEKYEYIIDLGKKLDPLGAEFKTTERKIKGCQSSVWLVSEFENGSVKFRADSDSVIVKGLVSLLIKVLSDQKPADIIKSDLAFMDKIGLMQHLAQTRSNGLLAMVKQMKLDAMVYQSQA
ncbi:MAG: SufE family protein [Cytophagales bacterium]